MGSSIFRVGYSGDTPSSNKFTEAAAAQEGGTLTAAIPGRTGFSARMRMPFYLIPGDLLLLSPMYFASPTTYRAHGGHCGQWRADPLAARLGDRFGRFQFVLGREIGATFYGLASDR